MLKIRLWVNVAHVSRPPPPSPQNTPGDLPPSCSSSAQFPATLSVVDAYLTADPTCPMCNNPFQAGSAGPVMESVAFLRKFAGSGDEGQGQGQPGDAAPAAAAAADSEAQ